MFDIFFLSYDEPNADNNFEKLKSRFEYARRIHGVKGIYAAHLEAAKQSFTKFFYVVDADAEVLDSFNFDHEPNELEQNSVHVWHSRNPVNGLEYGYGGVKLLPKKMVINFVGNAVDLSTSFSDSFKVIDTVSNITHFNTSEFAAWRSAFRECCKLASNAIDGQVNEETANRLNTWCTLYETANYGLHVYNGALAGKKYGEENTNNTDALEKINDFNWLKDQFNIQ